MTKNNMGLFITIEGGEFTGKTSVAMPGLVAFFKALSIPVKSSREPGGTPAGEAIRAKIFARLKEGADNDEAALLFNEARKIHLEEIIFPWLGRDRSQKTIMLLDRYLDTTRVYQGMVGGVPLERIVALEKEYAYSFYPDLTFILYFPEEKFEATFIERKQRSAANHREHNILDEGEISHHLSRQQNYLKLPDLSLSHNEKRNYALVDASRPQNEVLEQLLNACEPFLIEHFSCSKEQLASARTYSHAKIKEPITRL